MDDLDTKNKIPFEAESEALYQIKIKELQNALWFAAGYISSTDGHWQTKHPQECLDWLMAESKK